MWNHCSSVDMKPHHGKALLMEKVCVGHETASLGVYHRHFNSIHSALSKCRLPALLTDSWLSLWSTLVYKTSHDHLCCFFTYLMSSEDPRHWWRHVKNFSFIRLLGFTAQFTNMKSEKINLIHEEIDPWRTWFPAKMKVKFIQIKAKYTRKTHGNNVVVYW